MANNILSQNNPQDHNLDQQLDSALESYLPQPRTGLEQRILARAQSVTPRRIWLRPRFAYIAASALAACVIAAIFLVMSGDITTPHNTNTVASKILPSQPLKAASVQRTPTNLAIFTPKPTIHHKQHRIAHTPVESPLPRLAVFPAPAPPTPQEEELAMFAARYPKLLEGASRPKSQPIAVQPIQIKPLTIAPLSIASLDSEPNPLSHHPENPQ